MALNVIKSATDVGVDRLFYMGSSCIYPKMAPQPMKEEHLLSGPLKRQIEAMPWQKLLVWSW